MTLSNVLFDPNGVPCESCDSSGLLTSDTAVLTRQGILRSIIVLTNGTDDVSAIVYDNASAASGTVLIKIKLAGADLIGGAMNINVKCSNGLYLDVTGTGVECIIHYK